jgi:TolB-like protein
MIPHTASKAGLLERLTDALASRYELVRELGRGGMAVVYLARELKHDRWVALKVMHPELTTVLGSDRFLREVSLTARLDHPHILAVHDSGEASGLLWYTMPFVEGGTLRQRLDREGRLPIDEALRLAAELGDALDYAHSEGIVHRDVKPENILLARGHARLGDFGLARALEASGSRRVTGTGLAVGTPGYMSPEQASGGPVDGRSDIYALGCVLYEMLAGEQPYVGPTPQAALAKRLLGPPVPLTAVRDTVPAALDRAVTRALSPLGSDRFETAAGFRDALADVHTSGETVPPEPGERRSSPRHRRWPGAAAALVASAVRVMRSRGPALEGRAAPASGQTMLAVLPFETLGRAGDEYFADGLTEEITSRLAQVALLGVVSRTTAMQYRGTHKSVRQIGRELGVGYVLEGTVRWERHDGAGSRVRVTPQLIHVSEDRHLWADRYDVDPAQSFEAQSAIAERVSAALDVALGGRALVN